MKIDTSFGHMRSSDHLGDSKMSKKYKVSFFDNVESPRGGGSCLLDKAEHCIFNFSYMTTFHKRHGF